MRIRGFGGRVITPAAPHYDRARSVWNGAIDRKPVVIARCGEPADVAAALRHARETTYRSRFVAVVTTSPGPRCATTGWSSICRI